MREVAELVPTSFGPVGVLLSLPEGEPVAAAALLKGEGPARFGKNSSLALMARSLAGRGVAVLRMDYPGQGDSFLATDTGDPIPAIREVLEWFREWIGRRDLVLLGSCYGGRVAVTMAATDPELAGVAVIVPYPWVLHGGGLRRRLRKVLALRLGIRWVDRRLVRELAVATRRTPVWILAGDLDYHTRSLRKVAARVAGPGTPLELEVVPGMALHGYVTPGSEQETWERLGRRILSTARGTVPG